MSDELRLPGGNCGGAVRVGDTVRRTAGPWTPAVRALLRHVERAGFDGAPRALGVDGQGREILTYLPGEVVGTTRPWPAWVYSDDALGQVARWLRDFHDVVATFRPAPDAYWRAGGTWQPGLIIGHHDTGPYNAAWAGGRLTGFFDWDFAGPVTRETDLAFTAFGWVPLHARHVVAAEGFTAFADRSRRLRLFLDAYGWTGSPARFVEIVAQRVTVCAADVRRLAAAGDVAFQQMLDRGVDTSLQAAVAELASFEP
ncbi:phosphotransferase [Micromonosporaceae bacterium Da 78-11]